MPELPEVETVARTLAPDVVGKKLLSVAVCNAGSWQDELSAESISAVQPKILKVGRKGKLLLIYMSPFVLGGQ